MKVRYSISLAAAVCLTVAASHNSARAELIYGIDGDNNLVSFDSASPNSLLTSVAISGASILNIDIRPATGVLYGLDADNSLYTLDIGSGVASLVGTTTITGGFDYGFDFNPTVDRIRVTTDDGQNFRLNQTVGNPVGVTVDGNLDYIAGDVNDAETPALVGAAYANNFDGATTTTLYGIDANLDILARSTNANGGLYVTQGALGVDVTGLAGFDISGLTGTAYASLSEDAFTSQFYIIDLLSGAASPVGGIGSVSGITILDIAAPIPEPTAAILGGLGLLTLLQRRRRQA